MSKVKVTIYNQGRTESVEVNKALFTLGRSVDCDVSLADPNISRLHATIEVKNNTIFINDANSSNGTFLNQDRLQPKIQVQLNPGDTVRFGKSNIDLRVEFVEPVMVPLSQTENYSAPVYKGAQAKAGLEPAKPLTSTIPIDQEPPAKEKHIVFQNLSPKGQSLAKSEVAAQPQASKQLKKEIPREVLSENEVPETAPEKALYEAKRKAAQIILQSELEAEKAVRVIYEKAKAHQKETEERITVQMQKAQVNAEGLIHQAETEAKEIVKEARRVSQEMRNEVDEYVDNIKKEVLEKAEQEKQEILQNAKDYVEEENREVLAQARSEAEALYLKARTESEEIRKSALEFEKKIKTDLSDLESEVESKKSILEGKKQELEQLAKKIEEAQFQKSQLVTFLEEGHASQVAMTETKAQLEMQIESLKKLEADFSLRTEELRNGFEDLNGKFEAERANFQDKISREKNSIEKAEEARREEVRLELQNQAKKLEVQMLAEVVRSKDTLIQDIHFSVEKEMASLVGAAEWAKISNRVKQQVVEAVEGRVAHISSDSVGVDKAVKVAQSRGRDGFKQAFLGIAIGVALTFSGQVGWQKIQDNQNPMKARAIAAAQERQKDLEARKFNPTLTNEVKDSYTDAVIYTRNFTNTYTDPEVQKQFYKEASAYLLKTWRVEENKAIEVISISVSLVRELQDRREKIHPDYVQKGIQKMRELESETLMRLKKVLGSEVRVQSYKKFETEFMNKRLGKLK